MSPRPSATQLMFKLLYPPLSEIAAPSDGVALAANAVTIAIPQRALERLELDGAVIILAVAFVGHAHMHVWNIAVLSKPKFGLPIDNASAWKSVRCLAYCRRYNLIATWNEKTKGALALLGPSWDTPCQHSCSM